MKYIPTVRTGVLVDRHLTKRMFIAIPRPDEFVSKIFKISGSNQVFSQFSKTDNFMGGRRKLAKQYCTGSFKFRNNFFCKTIQS